MLFDYLGLMLEVPFYVFFPPPPPPPTAPQLTREPLVLPGSIPSRSRKVYWEAPLTGTHITHPLNCSHESHYKVSLQGIIIMKVNARSHCKESLQGVIARSHCKESLQGVIARSHGKDCNLHLTPCTCNLTPCTCNLHLTPCTWLLALGSLHLAPCTWLLALATCT